MIGYLDCSTGVSGDKFLGALLDAGTATGDFTDDDLRSLAQRVAPEARVHVERVMSRGISAVSIHVEAEGQPAHRTWRSIRDMLGSADLPAPVLANAMKAFDLLAEAEARVHGCDVDDVHFHEVGSLDSIVDVVGVCAGLHALGITALHASPPATGWGTVQTSHGVLPVPAPATERLLAGIDTEPGPARADGTAPGELTTPTGAALLAALAQRIGEPPAISRRAAGYGAGTRDIGQPNICRLTVGEQGAAAAATGTLQPVVLLETNLDHLSPEAVGFAADELLASGALDVWQTPVLMKKQRAAVVLSVLADRQSAGPLTARIHDLTGTLGVRRTELVRSVSPRALITFDTPYGPARAKSGAGLVRPEHDDVARIARENGRTYSEVRDELETLAREALRSSAVAE